MKRLWPGVGAVEPLAPGVYVDVVGNVHLQTAELLQFLGAPDTPENRRLVATTMVGEAKRAITGLAIDAGVQG